MGAGRGDGGAQPSRDPAQAGRPGDSVVPLRAEATAPRDAPPAGAEPVLFLLFALTGVVGILGLHLLLGSAGHGAALAALMLLGFTGLAWRRPESRRQPRQLGSRCAYLGLLYTLAGMAAVLVAAESAAVAAPIPRVLTGFGVAATAAMLGLGLRILLVQARPEAEPQGDTTAPLRARTAELEDELGLAVAELERFRLRTQQVLAERLARSHDGFAEQARMQADAIADLSARMMRRMDESLMRYADRAEALAGATAEAEARRAAALERSVAGIAEVEQRIQVIAAKLAESSATLAQGVAGVALLAKALPAAAGAAESLRAALTDQAEAVRQLAEASAADAREVRAQRDRLLADLDASREALGRTQHALVEIAETVADRLGG